MSNKATPQTHQPALRGLVTVACSGPLMLALFGSSAQASRTPCYTNLYSEPSYTPRLSGHLFGVVRGDGVLGRLERVGVWQQSLALRRWRRLHLLQRPHR